MARDDCSEKQVLVGFDHRHQMDVTVEPYHEDALMSSVRERM
jgi:hypothetical protein